MSTPESGLDGTSSQSHGTPYNPHSPEEWGKLLGAREENLTRIALKRHIHYVLAGLIPGFESLSAKERKGVSEGFYEEIKPSSIDKDDVPEVAEGIGKVFLKDALQDGLRIRFEQILAHATKNSPKFLKNFPNTGQNHILENFQSFEKQA